MNAKRESNSDQVEILIVEDSPIHADQLRHVLEKHHYQVTVAGNGREALAAISDRKPTIVVSDIVIPEIDGYQLCRQIKADENLKDIPVILLTALRDPRDVIRGLECGADNFITKPYHEAYLLSRIQSILANRYLHGIERSQLGVEVFFEGQKHFITSERMQILNLFFSTFEAAVQKNLELLRVQDELANLNAQLEQKAKERTAALEVEIGKHKRAQETLGLLSRALQQIADNVFITDRQGVIQYVNPAFEKLTGYTTEEVVGATPRILKSGVQDKRFYEGLWETILSGETFRAEFANRKKNGELYFEEKTITPIKDRQGNITHFVSAGKDVTERKQLEQQYRQAQKMEAVGTLAGGVAHDFNNLLTVILGYSQLLLDRLDPNDPLRVDTEEVIRAGKRAATLTGQLLAFSRRHVLQPRVLDLNATVAEVSKMLRRLIGEDIDLITLPDPALGHVKADPAQIEQVILNLAVNARDAMPEGGKLTIETANVYLDEDYARQHVEVHPGRYVMLALSDTGHGMDEQTQSHLFEPFFTTKELGKGTGLGLSTVYGIVKQSGGHILVYSEPGKGTSFKIYLPRIEAAVEAPPLLEEPGRLPQGTETVLVVEDEPAVRHLAALILRAQGYTVLEATNGEEALRVAQEHAREKIDLLLTDIVMPEMGGKALAQQLRAVRPDIKVLFASGYADRAIVNHEWLGTDLPFLQKPFTPGILARKVREVLDGVASVA